MLSTLHELYRYNPCKTRFQLVASLYWEGFSPSGFELIVSNIWFTFIILYYQIYPVASWAHVRRDFLNYAKGYSEQESWALTWVDRIGKIYHINNERIQHKPKSKLFSKKDSELKKAISKMRKELTEQLADTMILPSAKKILKSLNNHWGGLTIFVDRSEIPMDNNTAERGLRNPVVGRKIYHGSGSVWSAELAAALFTLFKTLKLWKINIHTWLLAYFHECALVGGMPPENINKFLPWHMTDEQKILFSRPLAYQDISK